MTSDFSAGNYRFIPAVFQYSGGVAANPGYEIERVRFGKWLPLADGFAQIAKHIQRTTDDLLQIEHGSLYPALHRLERKGWLSAKWEAASKDQKREFKYYRLTAAGKKQLAAEESKWKQMASAIARVMWPAEQE